MVLPHAALLSHREPSPLHALVAGGRRRIWCVPPLVHVGLPNIRGHTIRTHPTSQRLSGGEVTHSTCLTKSTVPCRERSYGTTSDTHPYALYCIPVTGYMGEHVTSDRYSLSTRLHI